MERSTGSSSLDKWNINQAVGSIPWSWGKLLLWAHFSLGAAAPVEVLLLGAQTCSFLFAQEPLGPKTSPSCLLRNLLDPQTAPSCLLRNLWEPQTAPSCLLRNLWEPKTAHSRLLRNLLEPRISPSCLLRNLLTRNPSLMPSGTAAPGSGARGRSHLDVTGHCSWWYST